MDKILADKLIAWYEDAIYEAKESSEEDLWSVFLRKNVHKGICFVAKRVFYQDISSDEWVKKNTPKNKCYFVTPPFRNFSKEENIESLQKRLDILKTFKTLF